MSALVLMKAARLHGAKDLRIDDVKDPGAPLHGQVRIRIGSVGVCGSDLHMYGTGAIGSERVASPLILGHEFMGTVVDVGDEAFDGEGRKLHCGDRVAVDPACPCLHCESCEEGNPNLCPHHRFYGVYPTDGALREEMIVGSRNCFPIPDEISDAAGALLETLGVAVHALDLGKLRVARSVAVIGCGPVGLLLLKLAKLAGADPIYVFDKLDWRLDLARRWGASGVLNSDGQDAVAKVHQWTMGRGVDVCFEAAWADESLQQAAEMARSGGRLVFVGIPPDDRFTLKHSTVRRKGLTLALSRRMKFTYPRSIRLVSGKEPLVPLDDLVSEQFTLEESPIAFEKNYAYEEGVQKLIVTVS